MSYIHNHEVTFAVDAPSPNTGGRITPRFIVMHYTAGFTAASAVSTFKSRSSRVSAHLTVDLDGSVYQHVPFNVAAWHAGPSRHMGYNGLNQHSIGIEIVNAGWFRKDGTTYYRDNIRKKASQMPPMIMQPHRRVGSGDLWWPKYTDQQLDAVEGLTRDILAEYDIIDIVSHEEIDTRGWKTDPGPAFPMERYKRLLSTGTPHRDLDGDRYQVTAGSLNVRSGPGTSFSVMGKVRRGDIVNVIDKRGDWARLDHDGNDDGWVHEAYIRRI